MAREEIHSSKRPVVLLIHGTFAHRGSPQSPTGLPRDAAIDPRSWWQAGNPVWTSFRDALATEGIALAGDAEALARDPGTQGPQGALRDHLETFCWDGANTERSRHQAAQQLLSRLLDFEAEGRDYHLIGHSHGGSIIWIALQKAILYRWRRADAKSALCRLAHLRSWSTVGTAFLHFRGTAVGIWYGKAITILTLLLCLGFGAWIVQGRLAEWQKTSSAVGEVYTNLQTRKADRAKPPRHPVDFTPLHEAGKEIQRTTTELAEAVHLSAQVTFRDWLTAASQILGSLLLVSTPFLTFYLWTHALRTEARNVYREQRAKNQAMLEFGDRWLGLWSAQDEAISGLRATTRLEQTQIIPRLRIPESRVFESDRIIRFWKPFVRLLLAPVYNRLFGPCADSFVLTRLTRAAQGNNRIGCAIVDVTETPVPLEGFRQYHLPGEIDGQLIDHANEAIGRRSEEILAKTRMGLSQFAWGSGSLTTMAQDVHSQLAGEELVHTSYFLSPPVRDLLCLHILTAQRNVAHGPPAPAPSPSSIGRAAQSCPLVRRASLWLLLAASLAVFGALETAFVKPAYLLIGALVLVGAAAATAPFRIRNRPPGKLAAWTAAGLGSCLSISGLAAALMPGRLRPPEHPAGAALWTSPPFLTAALLLGAALFFVASLTHARRSPLWASFAGWAGLLLLLLLIALSNWLLGEQYAGVPTVLLLLLTALFGLYHAFSPLKQAQDVFCPPYPAPCQEHPPIAVPQPSDWLLEFRKDMRERSLRSAHPAGHPLNQWLDHFRGSVRESLARDGELSAYALPRLGHPNRLALTAFILLTGGVLAGLLAPILLFLCGLRQQPALLGGVALGGWVAVALAILLSFGPAVRASRGARRGWMARLSLEFFSFAFLTGIAMLLGIAIRDQFFAIPDVPPPASSAWLATNPPTLITPEAGSLYALSATGSPPAVLTDAAGEADWALVAATTRGTGASQLAAIRGNELRVWDVTDAPPWPVRSLPGHQAPISALAYSPPEDVWISAATDREAIIWDARRGRETGRLSRLPAPVRSLAVHPSRPELALAMLDGSVQIVEYPAGRVIAHASGLPGSLTQLEYLPGNAGLLALDSHGTLRHIRRTKDILRFYPDGLPPWCTPVNPSPVMPPASATLLVDRFALLPGSDGSAQLALATRDAARNCRLIGGTLDSPKPLYSLPDLPGPVAALAFSPDGSLLAAKLSEARPPALWMFDVPAGRLRGAWERLFELAAVAFSPDGKTLATGSWGLVALWDPEPGQLRLALSGHRGTVSSVVFSPDGSVLASASYDRTAKLWNPETGQELATLSGHSDWVTAVAFSPDGNWLATASNDATIKLWDRNTSRELATLRGHTAAVTGVAFHPRANRLASASKDGTIRLWDLPEGRERAVLRGHDGPVFNVAFSPDGKILASGSLDETIKLWAPESLLILGTLQGHRGGVTGVVFAPDGLALASASIDRSLRLWDTAAREQKAILPGHPSAVRALAFSRDGATLASIGEEGTAKLWDVPGKRLRRSLCPWIFRPAAE